MPLLSRLKVSFAMVVLAIGVLVVLDMLVAWNIGHIIFSPWFVVRPMPSPTSLRRCLEALSPRSQ